MFAYGERRKVGDVMTLPETCGTLRNGSAHPAGGKVARSSAGGCGLHAVRSGLQSATGLTQENNRGTGKPPQAIRRAQMPERDRGPVDVRALSTVAEEATRRGILR